MSQNILKLSPEALELQLGLMSTKKIVGLFKALVDFKMSDCWHKYNPMYEDHLKAIMNLERKETILKKELQRRGWVNLADPDERGEYVEAERKMRKKKVLF